jgi:hypothetical protein
MAMSQKQSSDAEQRRRSVQVKVEQPKAEPMNRETPMMDKVTVAEKTVQKAAEIVEEGSLAKKPRRPRQKPVKKATPVRMLGKQPGDDDRVWAKAQALAGGKAKRISRISPTEVIVWNDGATRPKGF